MLTHNIVRRIKAHSHTVPHALGIFMAGLLKGVKSVQKTQSALALVQLLSRALANQDILDLTEDIAEDALPITIALVGLCNLAAHLEHQVKISPPLCYIVRKRPGKQQKSDNPQRIRGLKILYQ